MPDDQTPARQIVEAEIRANGPITFARFMEIALYGEEGYYTKRVKAGADYATSPQMHPAFAALIAGWLFKAWNALGEPEEFEVVELGAGDGELARDVLDAVSGSEYETSSHFRSAFSYRAFDVRPRGSSENMGELSDLGPIVGCLIGNELLDAFPAHIFTVQNGEVSECFVSINENGDLAFVEDHVSSDGIVDRLDEIAPLLPDGYRGEVNLEIGQWAAGVRRILERGYVLTIDYGHERDMLYHPSRTEGSLRCYRDHVLGQNPFRYVGLQDITTHVDFTAVDEELRGVGIDHISPLMSQRDFLFDLGIGEYAREVRRDLARSSSEDDYRRLTEELQALNALADVRGLGAFKVAQYGSGVPGINVANLETSPTFPLPRLQASRLGSISYD